MQVCAAEDQRLEDLPPGGRDGGHRGHGERAQQEAARGEDDAEEEEDEDEDEEDGCIVDEDASSQMLNVDKDVDNVFLQTGRRLEEAANGEVGKELGKVEFL